MKKRVLFCATVDYHFKAFHLPYLKWFKEQGWEVHIAASGDLKLPYVDIKFNIPIQRSPLNWKNIEAYKELRKIINENDYKIIHCHTPMGGVLTRLAAVKARKRGAKVIYTAHGFHFCKGAPLINWLLYYPIEKLLSRKTDCLITINQEDYTLALTHKFKAQQIEHVHGVGVNTELFVPVKEFNKSVLRAERGYSDDDFIMFYAAEFNSNKNQMLLIKAFAYIKDSIPNAKLLLAGDGELLDECRNSAEMLGIGEMVHFLGYRGDVEMLLKLSDLAIASSYREGLPVNILEAMAVGLPIVASKNRGHSELIYNGINGFIVSPEDHQEFGNRIFDIYISKEKQGQMRNENLERVKRFSLIEVRKELNNIYSKYMAEEFDETKSKHNRAYI